MKHSNTIPQPPKLIEGALVGAPEGYHHQVFDPNHPYTYCRICGWLYQPPSQRTPVTAKLQIPNAPNDSIFKRRKRAEAATRHEQKHSPAERQRVQGSRATFTPEAINRLSPFGIISLEQIVLAKAAAQAAREAPRISEEVAYK